MTFGVTFSHEPKTMDISVHSGLFSTIKIEPTHFKHMISAASFILFIFEQVMGNLL